MFSQKRLIYSQLILGLLVITLLSGCAGLALTSEAAPTAKAASATTDTLAPVAPETNAQVITHDGLPCLIHCNPPYETQAVGGIGASNGKPAKPDGAVNSSLTTRVDPLAPDFDPEIVTHDGLPCIIYCDAPYDPQPLGEIGSWNPEPVDPTTNPAFEGIPLHDGLPCLTHCNPPY